MSRTNLSELGSVLLSLPTNGADVRIYEDGGELMVDVHACRVDMLDAMIDYYYVKHGAGYVETPVEWRMKIDEPSDLRGEDR